MTKKVLLAAPRGYCAGVDRADAGVRAGTAQNLGVQHAVEHKVARLDGGARELVAAVDARNAAADVKQFVGARRHGGSLAPAAANARRNT